MTVNGTVQGLGYESATKSFDRFALASGAYFGTVEGLIPFRAAEIIPAGSCINANPTNTTLGYNKLAGIITYSQSFESRFKTGNSAIAKEEIQISFRSKADVIAEIEIPGKSDGPVLQDIETKTGLEKRLTVNYTMSSAQNVCDNSQVVPVTNQLLQTALSESDILVNNTPTANPRGEKPESSKVFKTEDTHDFNRTSLQFTRNVTWKYL